MGTLKLCLDEEYYNMGIEKWLDFDFEADGQRVLIVGPSGSGKTVFSTLLMGKLSLYIPNVSITVADYKGIDFDWLNGCHNYYSVDNAINGINSFFNMFEDRLYRRAQAENIQVLFVDELPSLLLSLSKKEQDELKSKFARLLNLSRALKIIIISAMQRPSAELFANGARDNYNIKFMFGANSKEAIGMIMSEYKEFITPCTTGVGYCTVNDMSLKKIRVAMQKDTEKLHKTIYKTVNR
ncbi:MAG: ATP-binding protein [Anaerocolumna sp.]